MITGETLLIVRSHTSVLTDGLLLTFMEEFFWLTTFAEIVLPSVYFISYGLLARLNNSAIFFLVSPFFF